jgi:hypothetical protein
VGRFFFSALAPLKNNDQSGLTYVSSTLPQSVAVVFDGLSLVCLWRQLLNSLEDQLNRTTMSEPMTSPRIEVKSLFDTRGKPSTILLLGHAG